MKLLSEALENVPAGEKLSIDEKDRVSCHVCGTLNSTPRYPTFARDVKLHTLAQGTREITIYDWYCEICREQRKFTGRAFGVFPARKKSCYTTELFYLLLETTCMNSLPFRTAYKATRLFSQAPTVSMRMGNNGDSSNFHEDKKSRRQANDAFRVFVDHLDTGTQTITKNLFSCDNCEVKLSDRDCQELGISKEDAQGKKRLKTIVIDGTSAGTLTKLPEFERETAVIPSVGGGLGAIMLVTTNRHRKILRNLLQMTRSCLREWKRKQRRLPSRSDSTPFRFWLRKDARCDSPHIQDGKNYLSEMETHLIQLYLSDEYCFCSARIGFGSGNESNRHTGACDLLKKHFAKTKPYVEIGGMLRQVYEITTHVSLNNEAVRANTLYDLDAVLELQNETALPASGGNSTEQTTQRITGYSADLILRGINQNPQFLESLVSVIDFLLLEHISLPYMGRTSSGVPMSPSPSDDAQQTNSAPRQDGDSGINTAEGGHPPNDGTSNDGRVPPGINSMVSFTENAFKLHDELCSSIDEYTTCLHFLTEGTPQTVPVECQCVNRFKMATVSINESNPLLGMFCQEFLKLKRPLDTVHCCIATSLIDILKIHKESATTFFTQLTSELPRESIEYYAKYGVFKAPVHASEFDAIRDTAGTEDQPNPANERTGSQEVQQSSTPADNSEIQVHEDHGNVGHRAETELQQSKDSGICFPGRSKCRPCIVFKTNDKQSCSKKYTVSRSHTPGLLTVQCACDSPKIQGFIIMTQAESVALALSSILTHFDIPPRSVFYDIACNLFTSTLLRTPWLLGSTRFAVDRFHYKSHKCSAYFNPDSYRQFDTLRTETAESINVRIKKSLNTIRYMNGDRLISFLRARFTLFNLTSCFKQKYLRTDTEDVNMTEFFHSLIKCECPGCQDITTDKSFNVSQGEDAK